MPVKLFFQRAPRQPLLLVPVGAIRGGGLVFGCSTLGSGDTKQLGRLQCVCDTVCDARCRLLLMPRTGEGRPERPSRVTRSRPRPAGRSAPLPWGRAKERTFCLEKESFGGCIGPVDSLAWNAVVKFVCRLLVSCI